MGLTSKGLILVAAFLLGMAWPGSALAAFDFLRMWGKDVDQVGGDGGAEICTLNCKQGVTGTEAGEFDVPTGIGVDGVGNVYVADVVNDRVQKFGPDGTFLIEWNSSSSPAGMLVEPKAIGFTPGGNVLVAEGTGGLEANDSVQEFQPDGMFVREIGRDNLTGAADIDTDGAGNIYVVDSQTHQVKVFSPSNVLLATWGGMGSAELQFNSPQGIVVEGQDVYVADWGNHRVQKLTTGGAIQRMWGLDVDPNQPGTGFEICVVNCQAGIQSGADPPGDLGRVYGIEIDPDGDVWVSEEANDRLEEFSGAGNPLRTFGSPGTAEGQFMNPRGLAADCRRNLQIADSLNHRVQKFGDASFPPPPCPPPPPPTPPTPPTPTPPAPIAEATDNTVSVRVLGKKLRVDKRGFAVVRIVCPAFEKSPPCRGTVALQTSTKVRLGREKKRKVVLAKARFGIPADKTKKVKLRIRGRKLRLLRRNRKARRVIAIVKVKDAAGNRKTVRKKLRLAV